MSTPYRQCGQLPLRTPLLKPITVLMADDNNLVRQVFRKILEEADDLEVVGEAKNGRQAVAMVRKLRPAIVLMDIAMPVLNGLQATRQILKAFPATKILILSSHNDDVYIEESAKAGAMGYLIKHCSAELVCDAIRKVQQGKTFFSPSVRRQLRNQNWKK